MNEAVLWAFVVFMTYALWAGTVNFLNWRKEVKVKKLYCYWCGREIESKQDAVYKKPKDDENELKSWFHKKCYSSHEDDCELENKRNRN